MAIARALVKPADIYVFDDSFSALDFKTDAKLRQALKQNMKESITVLVAQRVSTVMDADMILVLDKGKLVGKGTHDELLKTNETYQEIVHSQLREEDLAGVKERPNLLNDQCLAAVTDPVETLGQKEKNQRIFGAQ